MYLVLAIYIMMMFVIILQVPFPSQIDELPHFSVIRAQYDHPTLFPDWSQYRILRPDDLTQWSETINYINHPSLYYLMLAPLWSLTGDPMVFRIVNAFLSACALVIMFVAVRRRFSSDVVSPALFAIFAATFPKAAVVGGMVNNDNLAALAGAALFGGMLGLPGAGWWIMAGLAVAGWTKLTVFIGLAAVAGVWLGIDFLAGRIKLADRRVILAGIGLALGAIPYLVTFVRIGQLLWVNEAVWRVPGAQRLHLDPLGFARWFFEGMVMKWPASEFAYSLPAALLILLAPLILAGIGLRHRASRSWGAAYAAGLAVLLAIHFGFGWRSYQTLGDLTITQTRYYNILWPGIALMAAMAVTWLNRRSRYSGLVAAIIFLSPTMWGAMIHSRL